MRELCVDPAVCVNVVAEGVLFSGDSVLRGRLKYKLCPHFWYN